MNPKKLIIPTIVLVLVFVIFGDSYKFLPDPVRNASYSSRMFVIGLWPDWLKPKNRNEQREQQLEQLGQ